MTVTTEANNSDQMSCLMFSQGDRQGDTPAPQKNVLAYDNTSEQIMNISETLREDRAFSWVEPISGQQEMINRARYADDLFTVGLASSPNHVIWRVHDWDLAWSQS
eukprot:4144372-Heterocapsa_arctica.AAC.1